jgi:hypothetical protein
MNRALTSEESASLTLTLPADPDLAGMAGLVSNHFFRQNGLTVAAARRGARVVERRCRPFLRAAARASRGRRGALVLLLCPRTTTLEVFGKAAGQPETCLIRLSRTTS